MKAYYGKENNASKTAASTITKKDTATDTAKKALAKVETTDRCFEGIRRYIVATGKNDLFNKRISLPKMRMVRRVPRPRAMTLSAIYNAVNSFVKNYNSVMAAVDDVSDTTVNNRTESLGILHHLPIASSWRRSVSL